MKKTQKLIDFHMQFLKEVPHHTFKKIAPNKIYNIINDTNKKLILMKIYYIYAHYKNDKYFIKRTYWNKWKKKIRIFSVNNDNTIHLRNISGHCFSVEKIVEKTCSRTMQHSEIGVEKEFQGRVGVVLQSIKYQKTVEVLRSLSIHFLFLLFLLVL